MKKICLIILILMFFGQKSSAQNIIEVKYISQSNLRVWVAPYENMADLKVYVTQYENLRLGNRGHWYFCRYLNQANCKIFFVKNQSESDLTIFFVRNPSQAGWKNDNVKIDFYKF